jgi:nucleoside-diphosphate-sugar epimerase
MFLVTGATGFVGQGLQATLRQSEVAFRAVSRQAGDQLVPVGNIDANTDWLAALSGIEVVLHLASVNQNIVEGSPSALEGYRAVNVEGTLNLAKQAAAAGAKRFVYISSIKVNGESTEPGKPFTSVDTPRPQSAYGESKLEAEVLLRRLSLDTGLELVIIRPPLVYGPQVRGSFDALLRLAQRQIPLPLASIKNRRSMVYLENLTDLIVKAAHHPDAAGGTFMISDGYSPSTAELLKMIASSAGSPSLLVPFPPVLLEVAARLIGKQDLIYRLTKSLEVDISETCAKLDWRPPFQMRDALSRTLGSRRTPKETA